MPRLLSVAFIFLICITSFACRKSINNSIEYGKYINDPANGIYKVENSGSYSYSLKYLPSEYLAIQEMEEFKEITNYQKDSLLELYNGNMTFLFSVSSLEENITNKEGSDLGSSKTFLENIKDAFILKYGKVSLHPILATAEFNGGLSSKMNYYLVFQKSTDSLSGDIVNVSFLDRYFDSTERKFQFQCNDIIRVPKLNY